jgi:hypothetical protein
MTEETISQPTMTDEEFDARFDQEEAAFIAMHPQLMEQYEGKWVAVYGGQVVDVDDDDGTLFDRVVDKYGDDTPIYFQKVVKEVIPIEKIPGIDID